MVGNTAAVPWPIPGAPDDVRAWRLDLDLSAPLPESAVALLDDAEQARMARYLRHDDKVRFGVARASLKRLLADYAPGARAPVQLTYTNTGRPVWHGSGLAFNVAHSGALALIVISDRRAVGIDVERRRHLDIDALGSIVLTPGERHALEQMPATARHDAFHDYWVCKEAALKATGRGIGDALQRIEVRREGTRADARAIHCADAAMADADLLRSLTLRMLPLPDGYAGAVAWATAVTS